MLRVLSRFLLVAYALLLITYLVLRNVVPQPDPWLALSHTFTFYYFLPLPLVLIAALLLRLRFVSIWLMGLTLFAVTWFGPFFAPKPTPATPPDLTVVTYNMKREQLELANWLRDLNADFVFLQEIPFNLDYFEQLSADLADLYPHTLAQTVRQGNALLSRYPLTQVTVPVWSGSPPLHATAELAGQTIALFNVHLRNPLNSSRQLRVFNERVRGAYNPGLRDRQIGQLVALLEAESPYVVVAGDFNMSEYDLMYEDLRAVLTDSFRAAGRGLGNTWPDAEKFSVVPDILPPLLRLDYIWHGSGFTTHSAERKPSLGSDHYPVMASLTLQPSQLLAVKD